MCLHRSARTSSRNARRPWSPRWAAGAAALTVVALLTGCVAGPKPEGAHVSATPSASHAVSVAATATVPKLTTYSSPGGEATSSFANPQPSGAPLTFLVVRTHGSWLDVYLPKRPNESTGWVKLQDVTLSTLTYSLRVSTEQRKLSLYRGDTFVDSYAVATGTGGTPTPHGNFYLTELLAPTNSGYGPYAFGLSAFSDVLTTFEGGPGQIGLHGTDDESSVGRAVSHGCIRLANDDITALAKLLPLGTPVTIK